MRLRTLDLFSGGGGSSWGAKAAGADIVRGVDGWSVATETFENNFGKGTALNLMLSEDSSVEDLGDIGAIDLILASPECTNHTCAKGNKPRSETSKLTARYVINFTRKLMPRWVVIENVVHMRSWQGYKPLISDMEELGYSVLPQTLDASDFGVPQKRRRLFLLCDRDAAPSPVKIERPRRTAKSIIQMNGPWKSRLLNREGRAADTLARGNRAMAALGRKVPFLIVYYGSDGSGGWQPLDRPLRTLTTLDRFGLVTWDGDTPMLRMLQVPELKRAMGLDDDFKLEAGTRRDQIRLLGNGVCPPVMEAIVKSLTERVRQRELRKQLGRTSIGRTVIQKVA